jgi:hypothetical protein
MTIRQFIKTVPSPSRDTPSVQVGGRIPLNATAPLPEALVDALPKLAGTRFSVDASGAILIAAKGSDVVAAVLAAR